MCRCILIYMCICENTYLHVRSRGLRNLATGTLGPLGSPRQAISKHGKARVDGSLTSGLSSYTFLCVYISFFR